MTHTLYWFDSEERSKDLAGNAGALDLEEATVNHSHSPMHVLTFSQARGTLHQPSTLFTSPLHPSPALYTPSPALYLHQPSRPHHQPSTPITSRLDPTTSLLPTPALYTNPFTITRNITPPLPSPPPALA